MLLIINRIMILVDNLKIKIMERMKATILMVVITVIEDQIVKTTKIR